MKKKRSLMIFTRDLRLYDNVTLASAAEDAESVLPLFVFKDKQIKESKNPYFSSPGFLFLLDSLDDLSTQLHKKNKELYFYKGDYDIAIETAHKHHGITDVYISEDVTPYAKQRQETLQDTCDELDITLHVIHNHFLTKPGSVCTGEGKMYQVFTPFKSKAREQDVPKPVSEIDGSLYATSDHFNESFCDLVERPNIEIPFTGGRGEGLKQFEYVQELSNYKEERDFMHKAGTSKLSPHMKFGTISPREFYHEIAQRFGPGHTLITELYWRDFYAHLAYAHPYVFGNSFDEKYQGLEWEDAPTDLQSWKDGMTGYPIVDAGMRQLNTTGWMHNRARMITASFLTKHLLIDWREGEQYFAQKLVDYDPATNNGSWQWAASTGADAQPYFRIFNPWTQQEKFDKDCNYIREYVPELAELSNKEIHNYMDAKEAPKGYVLPMIEHKEGRERALERFKSL